MLRELHVTNLALIDDLRVELSNGFSVFTGETGAGKSILMDAIGLLLGERAHVEQVRSGADEAEVRGVFVLVSPDARLAGLLHENNIPLEEDALILRRRISRGGRSRVYANQIPIPLATLKRIGDHLVDIHGQHDHQSLLSQDIGRSLIDALPQVEASASSYRAAFASYAAARQALEEHDRRARLLAERRDVLEYQYRELDTLGISQGEEEELERELSLLSSSTDRASSAAAILDLLDGPQRAIGESIREVRRQLQILARLDHSVEPWVGDLTGAQTVFNELAQFAESYVEKANTHADPARVESINNRLAKIQRLKKKYRCSADQLLRKKQELGADLDLLETGETDRKHLDANVVQAQDACLRAGEALSKARRTATRAFDRKVSEQMAALGFAGGAWQTRHVTLHFPDARGMEELQFTVRTNPGEPFIVLSRSASGGEISRLMLAIKKVMARQDRIPVLIFDEIDTGIGGIVAHEVARCLHTLGESHQILCVSHLHQIASRATNHYVVAKQASAGRNVTRVRRLSDDEKVEEIARMLGGTTDISRRHARSLLKQASHS